MHRHQAFCNEETKLSPLSGGESRRHLGKLLEEFSKMAWINPTAGIDDTGLDKALKSRLEIDGDTTAWRRKPDRVADKIPEDLF